jgi:nitroreductase
MEFADVVRRRRMVRDYDPDRPVPPEVRERLLEHDRYAEPDKGWTDRDEARWPVPYWDVDAGMAALLVLLTAVDEGLGACFFGVPAERVGSFRAAFGVPDTYRPVGCVSVGYPGGQDRPSPSLRRGRRGLGEVVHRGRWGGPAAG